MRNNFSLRSLLMLRQEDELFGLLKREKSLEVFVAFLYEVYDKKNRSHLVEATFLTYLRNYLDKESGLLIEIGMGDLNADEAFRRMNSFNLVTTKLENETGEGTVWIVTTNLYKDLVRLLEERSGNGIIGGRHHIGDDIEALLNDASIISGDSKRYLRVLEARYKEIGDKISEIKKTGKMQELSKDEIRAFVHTADRRLNGFGAILSRGTEQFKEESSERWKSIRAKISTEEKLSGGAVISMHSRSIIDLKNSDTAKAFNDAVFLFVNADYGAKLDQVITSFYKNKDAVAIMHEDGINLRARLAQTKNDIYEYQNQISLTFRNMYAYQRSSNIERNRQLYKKSVELLTACALYGKEHSLKRNIFPFQFWKPVIVSPMKAVLQMPKPKLALIQKPISLLPVKEEEPKLDYRDISVVNIPQKFRRMLDAHNGKFTLKEYVEEEHTSFGMFEFLVVKKIMAKYCTVGWDMQREYFKITDYAPLHMDVPYTEEQVLALNFTFDEKGYELWKKDKFKI